MGGLEDHVTIIVNGRHYQHKKTTAMAVLPHGNTDGELYPNPESITLHPNSDPIEAMSSFEYLGSTMSDDCILLAEVEAHISKTSRAFRLLNRVLWYQRKIKHHTEVCLFNSVIIPVLVYGLEHAAPDCTADEPDAELGDEVPSFMEYHCERRREIRQSAS